MPLVGIMAGDRIVSTSLDQESWSDLRQRYRGGESILMSCGQPGLPKVSSRGLQYFAHKAGVDCQLHEGGETPEHLELKSILADAARAAGWEAIIEYPSPEREWIADVMAIKGQRRIVLEVQWSRQSRADFTRRQLRYESAGIECLWFVSPTNEKNIGSVPAHVLKGERGSWAVALRHELSTEHLADRPLAEAAESIMSGGYRDLIEPVVQAYSVQTAMVKCWKESCKRWFTLWRLDDLQLLTRCGMEGTVEGWYELESRMFLKNRIERTVNDQVVHYVDHKQVDLPKAAKLMSRSSKTADATYLAYCCPHCSAMFGDAPLTYGEIRWKTYVIRRPLTLPFRADVLALPHLCIDRGNGQCRQDVATSEMPAFPDGNESHVGFRPEKLIDRLPRLPRKGDRQPPTGRQAKGRSSRGGDTITLPEVLDRMTGGMGRWHR
jgi:hypothetical protein